MTNEALFAIAEAKHHNVDFQPLESCKSFTIQSKRCYIVLSSRLTRVGEKEALAHELGHCEYGGFYNEYSSFDIRAKAERRADKWSYSKLMPLCELKKAYRSGLSETWEIADFFDVYCEYAVKAISFYQALGLM